MSGEGELDLGSADKRRTLWIVLWLNVAIARLVLHRSDDERSWREKWWDRLRRNVTREERDELKEVT